MVNAFTQFLDDHFPYFDKFSTHHGSVLGSQLFLLLWHGVVSIYPLIAFFVMASSVHVEFWLGDSPKIACLLIPALLLTINMAIVLYRFKSLTARHIQVALVIQFILIGGCWMGTGGYVMARSSSATNDLMHQCGSTVITSELEAERTRVAAFVEQCHAQHGATTNIQSCPGFAATFPNPVWVEYLAQIETDFNCAGFCGYWEKPLFNADAEEGSRCATALGEEMETVAIFIGAVTAGYGFVMFMVSMCIASYDHV